MSSLSDKADTELSLAETARRHGVAERELREAVREGRPVGDGQNLDRYAIQRSGEIRFQFPSWYSLPADEDTESLSRDEPRGSVTDEEEPDEREERERRPRSSGKIVERKAAEAAGVLGVALLLVSALSD
jgi:hypothetical protein